MTILGIDIHQRIEEFQGLLEDIRDGIEDLKENTAPRPKVETHARRSAAGQAGGGGGTVDVILPGPPAGWSWDVERLAVTAGGGTLNIYLDSADAVNLVGVIGAPTIYADEFKIYVPQNRSLLFRFLAQPANAIVTAAIQAKQLREEHEPLPAHYR